MYCSAHSGPHSYSKIPSHITPNEPTREQRLLSSYLEHPCNSLFGSATLPVFIRVSKRPPRNTETQEDTVMTAKHGIRL